MTPAVRCANCEMPMCDKCTELDKKIAHLQDLVARILDPQTTEGIKNRIAEILKQKTLLHPDQEQ
jgi:hypothetical protein